MEFAARQTKVKMTSILPNRHYPNVLSVVVLATVQLTSSPATATPAHSDEKTVLINAVRGPELKSYRHMSAGLDAFDQHHALAPDAPHVRFRLRALNRNPAPDMTALALRIAGNSISIPLPIAHDHSFSLPRNDLAFDEDADLVLNKKRGDYRWDAVVNTPGVPEGMRRLGDLRLECQVAVAVGKKELNLMQRALVATVLGGTDWCRSGKMEMSMSSRRKIANATLIAGARRVSLKISDHGLTYSTPPESEGFPDDALVDIKFANEEAAN